MSQFLNPENMFVEGEGEYNFPSILPTKEIPDVKNWIEFDYAKRTTKNRAETAIHFFEFDAHFERVWANPNKYLSLLSQFKCVLSPDFSIYRDMPKAMQVWNHYRNNWLAAFWQMHGIKVIPNICWSTEDSLEWTFDGYPRNSVVAVSNKGCMREAIAKDLFYKGWNKMLESLTPSHILLFGASVGDLFNTTDIPITFIRLNMEKELQR